MKNQKTEKLESKDRKKKKKLFRKQKKQKLEIQCPCGFILPDNKQFFNHIKEVHQNERLSDIENKNHQNRSSPANNQKKHHLAGSMIEQEQEAVPSKKDKDLQQNEAQQPLYDVYEESDCDYESQIERISRNLTITYVPKFQMTNGDNCQGMASEFVSLFAHSGKANKLVICYLHHLKLFLNKKFNNKFWSIQRPNQVTLYVNEFIQYFKNEKQKNNLTKNLVIELTYLLSKWMYQQNWSNHKVLRATK